MTWILKRDDPGAAPSPELAAWTEEARQALASAAPSAPVAPYRSTTTGGPGSQRAT